MDVSIAFLHGKLSEEVYMKQPEGFVEPGKEKLVCRLNVAYTDYNNRPDVGTMR